MVEIGKRVTQISDDEIGAIKLDKPLRLFAKDSNHINIIGII